MLANDDKRIVNQDIENRVHFNADFENAAILEARIATVAEDYPRFGRKEWLKCLISMSRPSTTKRLQVALVLCLVMKA